MAPLEGKRLVVSGNQLLKGDKSKLFTPLKISNGTIELKHRIVMAPMTRNRGVSLWPHSTPESQNRVWLPDQLMAEYYAQRATDGGLLITESILPSAESGAMPGVPGMWLPQHLEEWKLVTRAVHVHGSIIYAQLTHHGRACIPHYSGHSPVSASATPFSTDEKYPYPPPFTPIHVPYMESLVRYRDHPPVALSVEGIQRTIDDYVQAARMAQDAGFDGVEIHAGNGYLVDQFLNSNTNERNDYYGGSPEMRCNFALELLQRIGDEIGVKNVAIRLSPFGTYNDMRDDSRYETWSHLLRQIKLNFPDISYVHFVEPREEDREHINDSWHHEGEIDLKFARDILHPIPIISAGGWSDNTCWNTVESGRTVDACAFARWFVSNPDLVQRLRSGKPLAMYNRKTFYGPSQHREDGYTDYPVAK